MGIKAEGIKVRANGKEVGCLFSLGNIKQSRGKTEKKCMTTGEIITILDTIKTEPINMSVEYDPTDTAGAEEIQTLFGSANVFTFEIELSDTAGNNGTTFSWNKAVVTDSDLNPDSDGEAEITFTVSPGGKPAVTAAA